jgi:uncharacterized protein (DUF1501 family)
MNRRHLLKASLALPAAHALAGLPASAFASAAAGEASTPLAIFVYLKGGNDGYSSFVPYSNPLYRQLRPTLAVPRERVVPINETHGFNAALAPMLPMWQAGEMALVQGVGFPDPNQQHDPDAGMLFAASDNIDGDGWLTRALVGSRRARDAALADAIAFGDLDIRTHDPMGPFRGQKLRVIQVQHPQEWLAGRALGDCTLEATPGALTPAAKSRAAPALALKTQFPDEAFGHALKAAVLLAATERRLPAIHITINSLDNDHHHAFDTHWDQAKYNTPALERLATGLAALRQGLMEVGRWQDSIVLTIDEFGRSPMENEKHGTHHGSANTQMVMGGRVKGGLYGEAPAFARNFSIGGAKPVIDYRELFSAVVGQWWGLPTGAVFDRTDKPLGVLKA